MVNPTLLGDLQTFSWITLVVGSILIGFSKTGISGLGGFAVVLFASVIPARASTGIILPLLIVADIVAVRTYRRHAKWKTISDIAPWTVLGVVIGYFIVKQINDVQTRQSIGCVLLLLTLLHLARRMKNSKLADLERTHLPAGWVIFLGIFAGITTMVANAAGPILVIYFLSARLPKMEFLGTSAWYFFILNSFKVPFSLHLGLITADSLLLNAILTPAVLLGAIGGRAIIPWINQKLFEILSLGLTVIAAARLLI